MKDKYLAAADDYMNYLAKRISYSTRQWKAMVPYDMRIPIIHNYEVQHGKTPIIQLAGSQWGTKKTKKILSSMNPEDFNVSQVERRFISEDCEKLINKYLFVQASVKKLKENGDALLFKQEINGHKADLLQGTGSAGLQFFQRIGQWVSTLFFGKHSNNFIDSIDQEENESKKNNLT